MEIEVRIGDETHTVDVQQHGEGWRVRVGEGEPFEVTGGELASGEWALRWAGKRRVAGVHRDKENLDLQVGGRDWRATAMDARKAALKLGAGGAEGAVVSQMPGVIVRALVAEGDEVSQGEPVMVVEAMKMENEFKAPCDGVVTSIPVQAGQAIESGTTILVIEPS